MRNASAYTIIIDPGKPTFEADAPPCAHCGSIMMLTATPMGSSTPYVMIQPTNAYGLIDHSRSPYRAEASFCRKCYAWICPKRSCNAECVPYLKRVDDDEAAARKSSFVCY